VTRAAAPALVDARRRRRGAGIGAAHLISGDLRRWARSITCPVVVISPGDSLEPTRGHADPRC